MDEEEKVKGVVTDHDIAMALATKNTSPADILVGEIVEKRKIDTCSPDNDVKQALEIMAEMQIRRLPVVSQEGHLEGIFPSMMQFSMLGQTARNCRIEMCLRP